MSQTPKKQRLGLWGAVLMPSSYTPTHPRVPPSSCERFSQYIPGEWVPYLPTPSALPAPGCRLPWSLLAKDPPHPQLLSCLKYIPVSTFGWSHYPPFKAHNSLLRGRITSLTPETGKRSPRVAQYHTHGGGFRIGIWIWGRTEPADTWSHWFWLTVPGLAWQEPAFPAGLPGPSMATGCLSDEAAPPDAHLHHQPAQGVPGRAAAPQG